LCGGPGVLNETVERPDLFDAATRIVAGTHWSGVGQIEMREDENGILRLMEFNTKFWGTLALSIAAGVNFPLLACKHAMGQELPVSLGYRVGVRYRWLFPAGITILKQPSSRWRILREMYRPHTKSDWSWYDIRPSLHQMESSVKRLIAGR